MSTAARNRLAGVFGMISVIGTFAGLAIHGYPDIGANGRQIARWAITTSQHQFAIGIYVEALAIFLFLGFAASPWSVVRAADGDLEWLATLDRSRVIPPDYRKLVTRCNGDVLRRDLGPGRLLRGHGIDSTERVTTEDACGAIVILCR